MHLLKFQSLQILVLLSRKYTEKYPHKSIQRHGSKFRVQKRVDGQLCKWTFDTLEQAVRKRDAVFAKVDAE